jgi:hypothetical protein
MAVRMRIWNPEWYSSAIDKNEIIKKDVHGKNDTFIEIFYSGTSSAAAAELGGAADSALDATTTPVQCIVVSASANDTNTAAGHVRKVRIIGISVSSAANYLQGTEDAVYSLEECNMNGTTNVTTSRYYLRVMHIYASDWGSGDDDAAGAITLEYPENTTLIQIAQNANESQGGTIYGADNHSGRWQYCYLGTADAAFNNT